MTLSVSLHHYPLPPAQGLYDPRNEHDACGIGFVASIKGHKSHDIIAKGIQVLINLTHRGACGCDPETGDGAGILIQIPHKFFARECATLGFTLPPEGRIRRGHDVFARGTAPAPVMRRHPGAHHSRGRADGARLARYAGGWRCDRPRGPRFAALHPADLHRLPPVPRTRTPWSASSTSCASAPKPKSPNPNLPNKGDFYIPSLSARTIVYKGLLLAPQMAHFYGELSDPDVMSALCLVHQRFSTNTFPTWQLAHPVPLRRAQRRNQHPARQRQLDARAPVDPGIAVVRRRSEEALSRHCARRQRFRQLRQRPGTALHGRPRPAPRHGDADSGSLGQQPAHEPRRSARSTNITPH